MKSGSIHAGASLRPRDPVTGEALPERAQPGYYPGFSIMSQKAYWDRATREVVEARLKPASPLRFFSDDEAKLWTAVFDHILPQTDRIPERRIPLIPALDERLQENRTVGYRFEDMPHDRDVYKTIGIQAINAEARALYRRDFLGLAFVEQEGVLRAIHDGDARAGEALWKQMSIHRFWQLLTGDAIEAYYAHPWAWDEIGFGGPAYPRAYMRLERGEPEPWEAEERRYAWEGPVASLSDETNDASHHHTEAEQHGHRPGKRQP
ncbi:gluconate 2-dehydrogenase subunit 3 family protein [Acidobacteria bacterium AB60]|nr:gluconate 2-dehydrogenase subunit 3 family protein [Acidobacteria bacterium AB60]